MFILSFDAGVMSLVEMMKSRYRASEKHRLEPNSTSTSCQKKKRRKRALIFTLCCYSKYPYAEQKGKKKSYFHSHPLSYSPCPSTGSSRVASLRLLMSPSLHLLYILIPSTSLSLSLFLSILQLLSSTWTNIFPHQATCLYTDTSVMSRTCTSDTGTGRLCQGAKNSFWSCVAPTSKCSGDLVHQSHLKCGRRERLVENSRVGSDGPSYSGLSTTSQDVIFYTRDLMECFCWSPWK